MTRLLLVRHAPSAETRLAAFPSTTGATAAHGCQPLDRGGRDQAAALAGALPAADRLLASLAVRARQTAELAGAGRPELDPDLAECDFGAWAGLTVAEVNERAPAALAAWWADPDAAAHGGETLAQVRARATAVMARAAEAGGTTVAVSHGGLVKAALLEVLGLPAHGLWRLDVAPASVTELRWSDSGWRVTRLNWVPSLTGAPR